MFEKGTEKIKEIGSYTKQISALLKTIKEYESLQPDNMDDWWDQDWRDNRELQGKIQDATLDIMDLLNKAVEATSEMGRDNGTYEGSKKHRITEK